MDTTSASVSWPCTLDISGFPGWGSKQSEAHQKGVVRGKKWSQTKKPIVVTPTLHFQTELNFYKTFDVI